MISLLHAWIFFLLLLRNLNMKIDERTPNVTLLSFMENQDHLIVLLFVENLSCEKSQLLWADGNIKMQLFAW